MPDEMALARRGDFEFAVKVTVLVHFDAIMLADALCTSLQIDRINGLE